MDSLNRQLPLDADNTADQMPLFGAARQRTARTANRSPLASAGDPISSRIAAEEVTNSGRRASQKADILAWLRERDRGYTSAEIAAAAGMDRHMVARRLPDLARDGLVARGEIRTCAASGRPAITWRAKA